MVLGPETISITFQIRVLICKPKLSELPMKLNIGRSCHRCTVLLRKLRTLPCIILLTGGIVLENSRSYDNSFEIINIETGTVTLCSPMNIKRACHGIGTFNIKNQPRISVFGGINDDSKTRRENKTDKGQDKHYCFC